MIGATRLAEVTILKNDNANGVLQFSVENVKVTEDEKGTIVNISRTAGLFGNVS